MAKSPAQIRREVDQELARGQSPRSREQWQQIQGEHPSGLEWSDLSPTGLRVEVGMTDIPLEDATAVEIRGDMSRRLAGYRALAHVPARRLAWARRIYELARAKPWVMDQVPHSVWGMVLADVQKSGLIDAGRARR
jgi:hypothetical protein